MIGCHDKVLSGLKERRKEEVEKRKINTGMWVGGATG